MPPKIVSSFFGDVVERFLLAQSFVDRAKFEQRGAAAVVSQRIDLAANLDQRSILASNAQGQPLAGMRRP